MGLGASGSLLSRWLRGGAPALLLALPIGNAWAQARVELQPILGVYQSFSSFPTTERVFLPIIGPLGDPLVRAQRTGVALGGALTVWLAPRIGTRLHVMTATSKVATTNSQVTAQDPIPSRVTMLGGDLLFTVGRVGRVNQVYLSAGGSLVQRSGKAYEGFSGTSDLAGTLGLGSSRTLNRHLRLQADVQMLLYRLGLTNPSGQRYPSRFQSDMLAYIGVVFQP
ncbi:MAG: hypothetical protein ACJ8BF_06285 [Gemmatimonadales bacterium]